MMLLCRHICLIEVGASLQHAISHDLRTSFFCEYLVLVGA